jgi:predicted lipoprotein with Yx(FWY)xxD motif
VIVLIAVVGAAVLAAAAIASASSPTLTVRKNVHVTNTPTKAFRVKAVDRHEAVAVGPSGFAIYTFQGETTNHIICKKTSSAKTNCWAFWPPVSVSPGQSISKAAGISGRLGSFRNHGVRQLTLNGQPLYYFTPDLKSRNKSVATGDELKTFGSIWHIVRADTSSQAPTNNPGSMQTTSTANPSPTSTNPYPQGY